VIISIMAGLHTTRVRVAMGSNARVIRAMPNMPCQIGAGMTAIALGDGAKPGDEALAWSLFAALGRTVLLDESLMHAVTAVSGSGPAYIFALAEAMEQAGLATGLAPDVARVLVTQTILGAARMLSESDQTAAALRQAVTSPGGTTAAALQVFEQRGFNSTIVDALVAARDRGAALGQ
jgi:pyrroline-5-carboxylate reductase